MKILKRDYDIDIHYEASKEDKQLFLLFTRFEGVSLKQLDASLNVLRLQIEAAGHIITMAEVRKADSTEQLTNMMFTSLRDIPEGIIKGGLTNG